MGNIHGLMINKHILGPKEVLIFWVHRFHCRWWWFHRRCHRWALIRKMKTGQTGKADKNPETTNWNCDCDWDCDWVRPCHTFEWKTCVLPQKERWLWNVGVGKKGSYSARYGHGIIPRSFLNIFSATQYNSSRLQSVPPQKIQQKIKVRETGAAADYKQNAIHNAECWIVGWMVGIHKKRIRKTRWCFNFTCCPRRFLFSSC